MRLNTDFRGKIMTKWKHINNKLSHFHLSYFLSRTIPISLSSLVPIPMGIRQGGFRISHFHAHLQCVRFSIFTQFCFVISKQYLNGNFFLIL